MSEKVIRVRVSDRVVIYPRGKKRTYVAEFWNAGAHRRVSLKVTNKKIAYDRALKIAAELSAGDYRAAPPPVTIETAVENFLAALTADRVSRNTRDRYTTILGTFRTFLAKGRVTRLSQVTLLHFDKYRAERLDTKHPVTVDLEIKVIKAFLRWCHDRSYLRDNPLAKARYNRWPAQKQGAPNLIEVDRILAAAGERLRMLLAVLAFSGMRSGELRRLRREDVDPIGSWIHIKSRPGAETKTRESRKVPIHPRLHRYLEDDRSPPGPWAFADHRKRSGETAIPVNQHALNTSFKTLLKQLDLPVGRPNGFVIHSFRHFFETHMVNADVPQRVIDTWLGHRSDRSMASVYFQLRDDESQRRMKLVSFETLPPAGVAGTEV